MRDRTTGPQPMPVARVRVDNNGGSPFETDVDVARGWMRVIPLKQNDPAALTKATGSFIR